MGHTLPTSHLLPRKEPSHPTPPGRQAWKSVCKRRFLKKSQIPGILIPLPGSLHAFTKKKNRARLYQFLGSLLHQLFHFMEDTSFPNTFDRPRPSSGPSSRLGRPRGTRPRTSASCQGTPSLQLMPASHLSSGCGFTTKRWSLEWFMSSDIYEAGVSSRHAQQCLSGRSTDMLKSWSDVPHLWSDTFGWR